MRRTGIFLASGLLWVWLTGCTSDPATLQPPPQPPVEDAEETLGQEIPKPLRTVFRLRCAECHGLDGRSGSGGNLYVAGRRTRKSWEAFLREPKRIQSDSRMPTVTGLTDAEYVLFADWLATITRNNPHR